MIIGRRMINPSLLEVSFLSFISANQILKNLALVRNLRRKKSLDETQYTLLNNVDEALWEQKPNNLTRVVFCLIKPSNELIKNKAKDTESAKNYKFIRNLVLDHFLTFSLLTFTHCAIYPRLFIWLRSFLTLRHRIILLWKKILTSGFPSWLFSHCVSFSSIPHYYRLFKVWPYFTYSATTTDTTTTKNMTSVSPGALLII